MSVPRLPTEEDDDALSFVPLAARRGLDHAGIKLSLEGWRSLSLEARRSIAQAGAGEIVDVAGIAASCAVAAPPGDRIDPAGDPIALPDALRELGVEPAWWASRSALERHALASYAGRGKRERALELLAALRAPLRSP